MEGRTNGQGSIIQERKPRHQPLCEVNRQERDQATTARSGRPSNAVPVHEIEEKAREYLAANPRLYEEALERAKRMGWIDLREPMVTPDLRAEQNS
jgi:hypothetical protein